MTEQLDDIKAEFFALMNKMRQGRPLPASSIDGLTHGESHAVHMIHFLHEEMGFSVIRPKDLAPHMHVSPSALSQVLKSLEAKGLLMRERNDADSRAVSLILTSAGKRAARHIDEAWCHLMADCVDYVGREDFLVMMRAMGRIFDFQAAYERECADQPFACEGGDASCA